MGQLLNGLPSPLGGDGGLPEPLGLKLIDSLGLPRPLSANILFGEEGGGGILGDLFGGGGNDGILGGLGGGGGLPGDSGIPNPGDVVGSLAPGQIGGVGGGAEGILAQLLKFGPKIG